jgi:tryptophanyl-tRNA synthetase
VRTQALEQAHAAAQRDTEPFALGDRERLFGWLEGTRKMILVEPGALLTHASRMPGLDGQKMSKSYGNTITLREDADSVTRKIRTMQTDPARVRRTDAGDPDKCPVWQFHRDLLRTTRSKADAGDAEGPLHSARRAGGLSSIPSRGRSTCCST